MSRFCRLESCDIVNIFLWEIACEFNVENFGFYRNDWLIHLNYDKGREVISARKDK